MQPQWTNIITDNLTPIWVTLPTGIGSILWFACDISDTERGGLYSITVMSHER